MSSLMLSQLLIIIFGRMTFLPQKPRMTTDDKTTEFIIQTCQLVNSSLSNNVNPQNNLLSLSLSFSHLLILHQGAIGSSVISTYNTDGNQSSSDIFEYGDGMCAINSPSLLQWLKSIKNDFSDRPRHSSGNQVHPHQSRHFRYKFSDLVTHSREVFSFFLFHSFSLLLWILRYDRTDYYNIIFYTPSWNNITYFRVVAVESFLEVVYTNRKIRIVRNKELKYLKDLNLTVWKLKLSSTVTQGALKYRHI